MLGGTQNLWFEKPLAPPAEDVITGLEFPVDLFIWSLMGQQEERKKNLRLPAEGTEQIQSLLALVGGDSCEKMKEDTHHVSGAKTSLVKFFVLKENDFPGIRNHKIPTHKKNEEFFWHIFWDLFLSLSEIGSDFYPALA